MALQLQLTVNILLVRLSQKKTMPLSLKLLTLWPIIYVAELLELWGKKSLWGVPLRPKIPPPPKKGE